MIPFRRLILISLLALPGIERLTSKLRASEETALANGVLVVRASVQTPSLPDARPRSDRFRCGGRESNFLAATGVL